MSHNRDDIIINALESHPDITPAQKERLEDIRRRHQYTITDRIYLARLTFQLSGE